ncbi:ammonia-forming nitrite reductase cytochrome c552 subunit [Ferrimonas pelagia]|uniref:nitrite reductase (cytochrome; ammonia-forming) n=2 Tax=Ferrimonas pelagia TaxID=1177826 RepID=A0ABP9F4W2_9GAMM
MNALMLSMVMAGMTGVAMAKPVKSDNEAWKAEFPDQYASWATAAETSDIVDLLESNPNLVVLWGGYGFAKDYNKARGHYYAVADVTQTLRTAGPMGDMDGPMPASCWSCKTPDVARLIESEGEGAFASKKWGAWGDEVGNAIGCADCHDSESSAVALSRPYAERAMAAVDMTFDDQPANIQAAQTCGQCHVEYYFDATNNNTVKFPWDNGLTAEDALAYFDGIGFADWTHSVSKAPMLKAQHPEFETWATSVHGEMEVTCIDCHMPKMKNEQGREYSKHNMGSALDNFDQSCSSCHDSQADMEAVLKANKAEITESKLLVEAEVIKAHYQAKAAWDAGADEAQMKQALTHIRHAQWFWDFATASHAIHAHNPGEAIRLLDKAMDVAKQAQAELDTVLSKQGVEQPVALPDLSSKSAAQKALGMDMDGFEAEKATFLQERADKEWPARL